MNIDHSAPKDMGWAEEAIKNLDERLAELERAFASHEEFHPGKNLNEE